MKHIKYTLLIFVIFIADQLSKWAVTEHIIAPLMRGEAIQDQANGVVNSAPAHLQDIAQGVQAAAPLGFVEWIISAPALLPYAEIKVAALLNIVMVWNRGISFGLFDNNVDYAPYFLSALSAVIAVWFAVMMFKTRSKTQAFSMALIIGGALGNIVDRVRFGAVIDFIDVHAYGYHWPAFNIADSAIVVGVFILAFNMFFFEKTVQTAKKSV